MSCEKTETLHDEDVDRSDGEVSPVEQGKKTAGLTPKTIMAIVVHLPFCASALYSDDGFT
jgi:hypothetical protein